MLSASNTVNNTNSKKIHIHKTFGPKRTEKLMQEPGRDSSEDEQLPITSIYLF